MSTAVRLDERRRRLLESLRGGSAAAVERPEERAIPRRAGDGAARLSFAQQRLWFLHQLDPESAAYNLADAMLLSGPLDAPALGRALAQVVARHEVLRTVFVTRDGEPFQRVSQPAGCPVARIDLGRLPASRGSREARRVVVALGGLPFDLARGPLLRIALLVLGPADHVLFLGMHHAVADGWSMGVLAQELTALYRAFAAGEPAPLPDLPLQYADYAEWQRERLQGEVLDSLLGFWRERLTGAPDRLPLPVDRPAPPVRSFRGGRVPVEVAPFLTEGLRRLGGEGTATLYMALLAALGVLLQRTCHQDDLLVGSPHANRNRVEVEGLIGLFVNTLVLRLDLTGDPSFRALLERAREESLAADAHQDLPFEKLVDVLELPRDLSRSPLFQVFFAFQRLGRPDNRGGSESSGVRPFPFSISRAQFELHLSLVERPDGLGGSLEYSTDLFDRTTAERLVRGFLAVLQGVVRQPDRPVSSLPLLDPGEAQQLRLEWNDTAMEAAAPGVSLHELVALQIERTPDAVAVVQGARSVTYRELGLRAAALARRLRELGCGVEDRVAVFAEPSLERVIALVGTLWAGAAYLPLDPDHPRERIAGTVEDGHPRAVLVSRSLAGSLPETEVPVLRLEEELGQASRPGPAAGESATDPLQAAYTLYTSGSTGRPKGVVVSHGAIRNRLLWMQRAYRLDGGDTVLQKTPFGFDVSVWEFFWPLLAGARLAVAEPGENRSAGALAVRVERQRVTVMHFVPSLLEVFADEPDLERRCRTLRLLVSSGEALSADLAARVAARVPARIDNLYGPTEAAVDVTAWRHAGAAGGFLPIGRPIDNTRIHLVDPRLRPVPAGVRGELEIGGVNLARGYLGRPGLTAERFVPDPQGAPGERLYRTGDLARHRADGPIEFLGRIDHQVKIRGVRVELGEVEAALRRHPAVREAVAVARRVAGSSHHRLVAYVVPPAAPGGAAAVDAAPPDPGELRAFLAERLPEAMVPSLFVAVGELPLTPSGKLDRGALPEPEPNALSGRPDHVAPETPEELLLSEVWREVLGVERVSAEDNFFTLGGDSILSLRVLSRARGRGLDLTLQQTFQHQTLRELARASRPAGGGRRALEPFELVAAEDRDRLPDGVEDAYPLSRLQAGMLFHSELDPGAAVYHDVFAARLRGPFDEPALRRALARVVRRHPVLRTSFDLASFGEPLQLVHEDAEAEVAVTDLRRLDPGEQDRVLARWMEEEKVRPFDWRRPPLLRAATHRLDADLFHFGLGFHHAILDGWSLSSLLAELFRAYLAFRRGEEPPSGPPPASAFRELVALEREALADEATRRFWTGALAGEPAALPRWPPPEGEPPGPGHLQVPIDSGIADGLQGLARSLGVPLKSVLLAAHARMLAFLTGSPEVVTGLVLDGRAETEGGDEVLGLFLNTLPLRLDLPAGPWSALVRAAFAAEREILAHRRFPMAELQQMAGGRPLFDAVFGYVHFHVYRELAKIEELRTVAGEYHEQTNFPFLAAFNQHPSGTSLVLRLEYDPAQFPAGQVEAVARAYRRLLETVAASPEEPHQRWAPWSDGDRRQLLGVRRPDLPGPAEAEPLVQRFERWVDLRPDAGALTFGDETVGYLELDRRANRLARHLRRRGVGSETLVGVLLERSLDLVVAILGVLKAGGAYLPLDPQLPADRLALMVEDSGARAVVATGEAAARLPRARGLLLVLVDRDAEAVAAESPERLSVRVPPEAAAYVIYTSGSTGRPKGVVVSRGQAARLFDATRESFDFGPDDVWTLFHSVSFDFSVWELWGALAYGGRLVVVSYWTSRSPDELVELLTREGVTVLNQTPSAFRQLAQAEAAAHRSGDLHLRWVIFGGEALDLRSLSPWLDRHGDGRPRLVNMYGITETTVHVTWRRIRAADVASASGSVIGAPIDDLAVYALDPWGNPGPLYTPGEIHVGGAGVARGYLGRPGLTAERFVPDPFGGAPGARLYRSGDLGRPRAGGDLEYLGRTDAQVKVRGFRIEPGEIEAALASHPAVADAAVILHRESPEDRRLVAYAVPRPSVAGPVAELLRLRRTGRADGHGLFELPNGRPLFHLNRSETEFLYQEILVERSYWRHGVELAAGDCVVDVGANIGLVGLAAAWEVGDARYIAFEPMPRVFELLVLNAQLYGLDARLFDCGLGAAPGEAEFVFYPHVSVISGRHADAGEEGEVVRSFLRESDTSGASSEEIGELVSERLAGERVVRPIETLSRVLDREGVERIDLLKIDVEKSEREVLEGIEERHWPIVRQVVVEVHDLDGRLAWVRDLLAARGFEVVVEQHPHLAGTPLHSVFARRSGGRAAAPAGQATPPERFRWCSPDRLVGELREAAEARLPEYMVPGALVLLERLPLTHNGKLDRRALPAPAPARASDGPGYVAPRNDTEREIARIWSEVLGAERVGVQDHFLELGGHSLLAMQAVSRLRGAFGVELPLRTLYQAGTLAELALAVDALRAEESDGTGAERGPEVPTLPPAPADRHAPVPPTDAQEAYWLGRSGLFDLGGSGANVYLEYSFPGAVWPFAAALDGALRRVIERHEILRTVIDRDGRLRLLERVPEFRVQVEDVGHWRPKRVEEHLEAVREELRYARRPSGVWPLFEVVLHQLPEGEIRLHARFDAVLIDGLARGVLLEEVVQLLDDPEADLPPLEISFLDWARALEAFRGSAAYRRSEAYWLERIPNLPGPPVLPLVRPLGPETVPKIVRRREELLTAGDWLVVKERAAARRLTASGVLVAAFAEALRRHCREPDFTLGLVGSDHPPIHPAIRRVLGNYNTLHLLELQSQPGSFESRAAAVQERLVADLDHQHFSGHRVLRELNRRRGAGVRATLPVLFDSVVEPERGRPGDGEADEGEDAPRVAPRMTEIDLMISLPQILLLTVALETGDGALTLINQAVEEVFPEGLIPALLDDFQRFLQGLAESEERWTEAPPAPERPVPAAAGEPPLAAVGYGTDLRWIEEALSEHPNVTVAAVEWRPGPPRGGFLRARVQAAGGPPAPAELRDELLTHLRTRLPAHLVPAEILLGDEEEAEAPAARRISELPEECLEARLAALWEELLGRGPETTADDFFDLGGDSLAAVRLLGRLPSVWQGELPVEELFARPTVSGLAEALRRRGKTRSGGPGARVGALLRGLTARFRRASGGRTRHFETGGA